MQRANDELGQATPEYSVATFILELIGIYIVWLRAEVLESDFQRAIVKEANMCRRLAVSARAR